MRQPPPPTQPQQPIRQPRPTQGPIRGLCKLRQANIPSRGTPRTAATHKWQRTRVSSSRSPVLLDFDDDGGAPRLGREVTCDGLRLAAPGSRGCGLQVARAVLGPVSYRRPGGRHRALSGRPVGAPSCGCWMPGASPRPAPPFPLDLPPQVRPASGSFLARLAPDGGCPGTVPRDSESRVLPRWALAARRGSLRVDRCGCALQVAVCIRPCPSPQRPMIRKRFAKRRPRSSRKLTIWAI